MNNVMVVIAVGFTAHHLVMRGQAFGRKPAKAGPPPSQLGVR